MTNNDQEAYDTDNSKLVPVPFKLFRTDRSYGNGTTRVATKAIGIKSNVTYGKIFKWTTYMHAGWETYFS